MKPATGSRRADAIGLLLYLCEGGDLDDSDGRHLSEDDIRGMRDEDVFEWMAMLGYEYNGKGWFVTTHPPDEEE